MPAKSKINQAVIEADWIAGILSPEQIAEKHLRETGIKVSRVAIEKHFKKAGIERDLTPKIIATAEAKVARQQARLQTKVAETNRNATINRRMTEKEVVEQVSQTVADIMLAHRKSFEMQATLHDRLMAELFELSDPVAQQALMDIQEKLLADEGASPREMLVARSKLQNAIDLANRAGVLKTLVESHKTIVAGQRVAFGMDKPENDPDKQPVTRIERQVVYLNAPTPGQPAAVPAPAPVPMAEIVDQAQDVTPKPAQQEQPAPAPAPVPEPAKPDLPRVVRNVVSSDVVL